MAGEQYEVKLVLKADDRTGQVFPQLNRQLVALDQNGNKVDSLGGRLTARFNSMRAAAGGFYNAIAGSAIVGAIVELNELGEAANRAEQIFTQLEGSPEAAAESMNMLREATLGVIDDMTLMQKANQLLITGLAENSEEAARFLGLATRLGPAVGASVEEAVASLNSALLNQSYDVLDSLGISAGAVRERANELKEAGMAFEDAFRIAVLEQGDIALQRLGDSAEIAAEGISTAQVAWNNWIQDVAQGINNTLRAATETIGMTIDFLNTLGDIAQDRVSDAERARDLLASIGIQGAPVEFGPIRFATLSRGYTEEQIDAALMAIALQDQVNDKLREGVQWIHDQVDAYFELREQAAAAAAEEARRANVHSQFSTLNSFVVQGSDIFRGERGRVGETSLFSEDEALQLETLAAAASNVISLFQQMHQSEIISDAELDNATAMRDRLKEMADEARRGADALEDMTLQQGLLGGTDQNELFGGLADELMSQLQDNENLTAEERQAIQDALDEASGRATEVTFTLRDSVIPKLEELAEGGDTDALIEALQGVESAIREGRLLGLTEGQISTGINLAAVGGSWETYFESLGEMADLMPTEDDMNTNIVQPLEEADQVISGGILTGMAEANKQAENFASALYEVTQAEHKVKVTLDVSAPSWLQPLLSGNLERLVRDNGGIVPGQDRRSGGRFQVAPT